MIKVLFVCLGNICRSPMAEAVFRKMVETKGLKERIAVDSAGTGSWHTGNPPHHGTREILDRYQISYEGIQARQVEMRDLEEFTYIIGMDNQNIRDLQARFASKGSIEFKKLMDFVEDPKESNVPDPYYTGDFDYTYELVTAGCEGLLNYIQRKHDL